MDDIAIDRLRSRVLDAARRADVVRRRRHRVIAALAAAGVVALVTAGAVVLTAPPPPPPLPPTEQYALYETRIEAEWESLRERYPDAVRPDVEFERFLTDEEYDAVTLACLREQGIPAEIDQYGVGVRTALENEEEHRIGWFVCGVRFPLSPNESLAYTEDELRYIYRYFVEQLTLCLENRGYDIAPAPSYPEFRARWWTDDTWSPYRDVAERDAETARATESACPPMPPDLRP